MLKKLSRILLLPLLLLIVFCARAGAQDVLEFPDINTLTPENIFEVTIEPVYSMLVVLFGYLSAFIPGIRRMNTYARVLAFGLVAGLAFYLFGASVWKIALTFLITTGLLYDGMLKPLSGIIGNLLKKKAAPAKG